METNPADLQALVNLLNPQGARGFNADSDTEEEQEKTNTYQALTPSSIGSKKDESSSSTKERGTTVYKKIEAEKTCEEIYDPETEYFSETETRVPDWKKSPEWDLSYKQNVTPSDVFLGMSGRSPATFSCEDIIVSIKLPGENRQNMDLKVTKDTLQLTSPQYFLRLLLPHRVDPQKGNSTWDSDKETLLCTLRMDREFDYVNF